MRRTSLLALAVVSITLFAGAGGKPPDPNKVDLTLRATPPVAFAPVRVSVTAQLKGGPNDNPELYCPSVEWDWGDGTVSQASSDCDPYQANKSEIKRSYISDHVYKFGGEFTIRLNLKKQSKVVVTGAANLNIGLAIGEGGDIIR